MAQMIGGRKNHHSIFGRELSAIQRHNTAPPASPKKWYGGKRQANTGSAGALARYEREARNSYSVKRFEIERAAGEGARAPSTNRLVPDRINFLGKADLVNGTAGNTTLDPATC